MQKTHNLYLLARCLSFSAIVLLMVGTTSCKNTPNTHADNIFRYNQVGGLESLDPAFAKNLSIMWGVKFIYNTLFELDDSLNISHSLCDSFTISPDGRSYTFHIRDDVFFHDHDVFPAGRGRKMTSDDIIYSLSRLTDPTVASPGGWLFNGRLDEKEPFLYLDEFTFMIQLKEPFAPLLKILTMPYCSVVPREVVEHYGKDFRNHPCGTGPFRFVYWEEGSSLLLHKNARYWERDTDGAALPFLDGIQVSFNETRSIELLLMLQGELDFINGVDGTVKDILLDKQGELKPNLKDKIALRKSTYLNSEFLGILTRGEKADSILLVQKVRQAINKGIDKKKLVTYYRNGVGIPAHGGLTPATMLGEDPYRLTDPLDKKTAKEWIQQVKDSLNISEIRLTLSTVETMADMCNFIANELRDIGVYVHVEIYQAGMLRQMMSQNQLPLFKAQWIADYSDPETYMAYFYSAFPSPPNYTRTHIEAFDRLYIRSLKEADEEARNTIYKQMDSLIAEQLPVIPLFYDEMLHFLNPNINGFKANALNIIDLKRVRKRPL